MNDLISRQDAIDKAILVPIAKIVTEDRIIYRKVVFVDDIEKLPSAEPQIIRCKDCKWYAERADFAYCSYHDDDILWMDDDYCSYATRRTE